MEKKRRKTEMRRLSMKYRIHEAHKDLFLNEENRKESDAEDDINLLKKIEIEKHKEQVHI